MANSVGTDWRVWLLALLLAGCGDIRDYKIIPDAEVAAATAKCASLGLAARAVEVALHNGRRGVTQIYCIPHKETK